MVGICHGYSEIYRLADELGFDRDEITFELPGVNHFLWLTKFYHKGVDAFPIGDACTPGGGSWPYWYHTSTVVESKWGENPEKWWDEDYFGNLSRLVDEILELPCHHEMRVLYR